MVYRKVFAKILWLDAVCVGTVAAVAGLNMFFVFGFHLTVPYVSVFKYNYLALPFYCLLAASLVAKSGLLIGSMDWRKKIHWVKPFFVGLGLVLLFGSMFEKHSFFLTGGLGLRLLVWTP